MQRIKLYSQISTSLVCLSNEKLKQILADSKPMHEGIGGKSALISIDDTSVFVKKVPRLILSNCLNILCPLRIFLICHLAINVLSHHFLVRSIGKFVCVNTLPANSIMFRLQLIRLSIDTHPLHCSWMNFFKSFRKKANQPHILQHK